MSTSAATPKAKLETNGKKEEKPDTDKVGFVIDDFDSMLGS